MNFDPSEIRALVRLATQQTGLPINDEDLVQDAALKAMEAFRRQLVVRYPRAFLRKIVRDAVNDHWRRRRATEGLDAVDANRWAHAPAFEEDLDRHYKAKLLRRGMELLDPGKRLLLDLFYLEERSILEIARMQGRSVSAVKMELLRGRRRLAEIVRHLAECRHRERKKS
jgi:RNA polymerase sigma factor (sigma-70 family)